MDPDFTAAAFRPKVEANWVPSREEQSASSLPCGDGLRRLNQLQTARKIFKPSRIIGVSDRLPTVAPLKAGTVSRDNDLLSEILCKPTGYFWPASCWQKSVASATEPFSIPCRSACASGIHANGKHNDHPSTNKPGRKEMKVSKKTRFFDEVTSMRVACEKR
jgi:hypothetical protein